LTTWQLKLNLDNPVFVASCERRRASRTRLVREASDRHFHLGLAQATGNGSLELVVVEIRNRRAEMWRRTQQHFHTRKLAA
jgi:DNA-binding FadR family transcriptional regulator